MRICSSSGPPDRALRDCTQAAWSPDGSLAYADKTTVHVLTADRHRDQVAGPARHHPRSRCITTCFAGFADGSVRTLGTDRIEHRHAGPVTALAVADDGTLISASSDLEGDHPVEGDRLVIAVRDRQSFRLRGHAAPIDTLTVRGSTIVSAGRDGEIRAWVLPPPPVRRQWKGDGKLSHAAIADDGTVALAHAGPAIDVPVAARG